MEITNVGTYLAKKRKDAGLTQVELATALGFTTSQFVSNWERSVSRPSTECVPKLIEVLKLDVPIFKDWMRDYYIGQVETYVAQFFHKVEPVQPEVQQEVQS